jgi:hypothetical protein
MGLDLATMLNLIYTLFVEYVFGSVEFTFIGVFLIVCFISWKLHVSADGWVLVFGGFGAVFSFIYLTPSGLLAAIIIGIAVLIYLLLRRLK